VLAGVSGADFHCVRADKACDVPTFVLADVGDLMVSDGRPVEDIRLDRAEHGEL
jgi:hypothetical protein